MCIFLICLNNNNIFIAIVLFLLLPSCFAVVFHYSVFCFSSCLLVSYLLCFNAKLASKEWQVGEERGNGSGGEGRAMLMWDEPMVRQINMQRAASFSQLVEFAQKSW